MSHKNKSILDSVAMIISLTVFFVLGLIFLLVNYKKLIISKRRPKLLLLGLFSSYISLILSWTHSPCISIQFVSTIALVVYIIRTTFIFNYLVEEKSSIKYLTRFLWDEKNKIRKSRCILFAAVALILSEGIPLIYNFIALEEPDFDFRCEEHPFVISYGVTIALMILEVTFVIGIIHYNVKDRIGMRNELLGKFVCTIIIAIVLVLSRIHFEVNYSLDNTFQGINFIFWGAYYPILYFLNYKLQTRNIQVMGTFYNIDYLEETARQFFCEENVKFLRVYEDFERCGEKKLLDIIYMDFINVGSIYQLNICESLRLEVLENPSKLYLVAEQIVTLVNDNILPYVK
eukprot:NODE_71_length_24927_cov_1.205937.p9 type:complete len:345 gc:universal NODE_71_length_24927_cov_1.205937:14832-13798(-)